MFIADTHSDTLYNLYRGQKMSEIDITPERLREGGVTLQTFALWSGSKGPAGDDKAIAEGEYAARRQFIDDGAVHVSVQYQRQRTRNRSCRHNEHMRTFSL